MLDVRTYSPRQRVGGDLVQRGFLLDDALIREAEDIVAGVRDGRAGALLNYVREHGGAGVEMETLRISEADIAASRDQVSEQFLTSLSIARVNIRRFHEYQRRKGYVYDDGEGVRLTRQVRPIARVGMLCGHSFMALLMHAVPAQVAGVKQIAVAVAPNEDGTVDPKILATARGLGLDELYRMSGAEAVAAMALGIGPVARVDKIVGPGGKRAVAAKRSLSCLVGVDGELGLGELVVVADGGANAKFIAGDLLAQAEHGSCGPLTLLTNDRMLAEAVRIEINRLAELLPDSGQTLAVINECGAIYLLPDLETAVDVANAIAPARLSLQTMDNDLYLPEIETAGAVFVGPWAAEMTGDYFAGLNSFLPAFGSARYRSGLGVDDFTRETAIVEYGPERLSMTGRHMVRLAEEESLPAHAEAVKERLDVLRLTVE